MELEAAKVIGAGLAVIGVIGSGIGIGIFFHHLLQQLVEIQQHVVKFLQ